MQNFDEVDFFTDKSLVDDPHPYFDYLRAKGPAVFLPARGVYAVAGYEEGVAVFQDEDTFSSFNAAYGPKPLPFTPAGDDITDLIEANRAADPTFSMIASHDPPVHTRMKSLLRGLITPKRLKENEEYMWALADRLIDEFIGDGEVELMSRFAKPFATLVIADLLGVPEEDREEFRAIFEESSGLGLIDPKPNPKGNPLQQIGGKFFQYIAQRRAEPRKDVMTSLAQVTYLDGTLPSVPEVVALATFLFAAGQETTVRVIGGMLRILGEDQALQGQVRADRSLIPAFVEETLRMESALKSDFRLTRVKTKIGDVVLAPGTPIMLIIGAMNRDPRKFENPHEFRIDRPEVRSHAAFGVGVHACVGAPLARAELKVTLQRLFDRTAAIGIDDSHHGAAGSRKFTYDPSYVVRGLTDLYLTFTANG
jgi:cytochrome P450